MNEMHQKDTRQLERRFGAKQRECQTKATWLRFCKLVQVRGRVKNGKEQQERLIEHSEEG